MTLKNVLLFLLLVAGVLIVNLPIISFDMMYPEQPLIYSANQELHSWWDLVSIYLHPKMFHLSILFFRPSGHFLIYQLLEPILGWHNTRGLIIVNLIFLALSGYLLLKLYASLFPRFKIGGYLAFSLYLMHPALFLSRLIVLHFEFAYVFFVILSLFCFTKFCEKPQRYRYLGLSLLSYLVAFTFKEAALFLGPVLLAYYVISQYQGQRFSKFMSEFSRSKEAQQLTALIAMLSFALVIYLSMQWPSLHHPMRNVINTSAILGTAKEYFMLAFGLKGNFFPPPPSPAWLNVVFPFLSSLILESFLLLSVIATLRVFLRGEMKDKKALGFLYLAAFIFILLPLVWAEGNPWHLNLTLLFLSMIMGFSAEYLAVSLCKKTANLRPLGILLSIVIGMTGYAANQANIGHLLKEQGFSINVGRNAVFYPPDLSSKLKSNSIIVVEDSVLHDPYWLGAGFYPYVELKRNNPNLAAHENQYESIADTMFIKHHTIYNGSLFKWAYLKPSLQEEVFPFQVEKMQAVPDLILYGWLQNRDNIFCLGYDKEAKWHDKTLLFRKNLLLEKKRRGLVAHTYTSKPETIIGGKVLTLLPLTFPESQPCKYICDQNKACKGFTYINAGYEDHSLRECIFYRTTTSRANKPCASCEGFIKA